MIKRNALLLTIFTLVLSMSVGTFSVQGSFAAAEKGKQKKGSPFLITGKLPHMTKQVMQVWDNPEFDLSEEQKEKLLLVRKETMSGAQKLGKVIGPLEQQVVDGILGDKTDKELAPIVQKIAEMKVDATMIHLRCIANTRKILNDRQEEFLKNL